MTPRPPRGVRAPTCCNRTYREPARVVDVSGRVHTTAGADIRLFEVALSASGYRPQLSLTADRAPGHGNVGASVGYWK